jgi:hypothetical protein
MFNKLPDLERVSKDIKIVIEILRRKNLE